MLRATTNDGTVIERVGSGELTVDRDPSPDAVRLIVTANVLVRERVDVPMLPGFAPASLDSDDLAEATLREAARILDIDVRVDRGERDPEILH